MSSLRDSGVWPKASRKGLEAFFFRFANLPTSDHNVVLVHHPVDADRAEGELIDTHVLFQDSVHR